MMSALTSGMRHGSFFWSASGVAAHETPKQKFHLEDDFEQLPENTAN